MVHTEGKLKCIFKLSAPPSPSLSGSASREVDFVEYLYFR